MSRSAYIARTAHDLDQVNRIGLPSFSLVDFRLFINGKKSKYYLPEGAPVPKEAETGVDTFHFIPEMETVEIQYEIDDRASLVTGAKLELFTNFKKTPLWTLDFDKLGDEWWRHGKHKVKWDGRILADPTAKLAGNDNAGVMEHDLTTLPLDKSKTDFPEGYATLEFPPYKFRLTLTSKDHANRGNASWGWTYWHILIKGFELDLGAEDTIPAAGIDDDEHKRNKAVRTKVDTDGKIPGDGATRKVMLVSNIYKTDSGQMSTTLDFTEYRTMWGDGPKIPVIAKIRLADSNDAEVKLDEAAKGAACLGNAKFLWDWEDPEEDSGQMGGNEKATKFVEKAIKYKKASTDESPKGDNCHFARGGKRGPGSALVFPEQAGYDAKDTLDAGKFPFQVEKAKKRKWAGLSKGWSKGALKGCTGVVFQPSRMAGDDYVLTVYLANEWNKVDERRLDNKDEKLKAQDTIKKKSGKFQTWREIHLAKYIRKKNSLPDFLASDLNTIKGNFEHAYIEVVDKNVRAELAVPNYNDLARGQLTATNNYIVEQATDPLADHSSTPSAFLMRSHNDFKAAIRTEFENANPTADPVDITDAVNQWLRTNDVSTDRAYADKLDDDLLDDAALALAGDLNLLAGVADGITILHFDFSCNVKAAYPNSGTYGAAIDVAGNSHQKVLFVLFKSAADTFVHEIGHHMFLAHFGPRPSSFEPRYHDKSDKACIMSYNRPRPAFCGFCMLRLRGWNGDQLQTAGPSNSG